MQRPIDAITAAPDGAVLVQLSCGHALTLASGSMPDGDTLNCEPCDRLQMPTHFVAYKETPIFTETSVPAALRRDHSTKRGVWAQIRVASGRLRYRISALDQTLDLAPGELGTIAPEVLHSVEPLGDVAFSVRFYRAPTDDRI